MASAALQITNTVEAVNVQRDKDHYHPTGDSVIQVESTLFKIHKFPLMHNSPIFATIFDLPVGLGTPEGLSDDFPIVLEGEKADEFRALLKYTSAPPLQAQVERMTEAVLPEIISLVKLSHKYQMDHWKDWGLEVLVRLLVDLSSLPAEHLQPLYSLYSLLEDIPARIRMMKHWCQVINSKNLSIVPVIDAAEKWGNRDSLAEAYCMQIRRWEKKANILDPKSYSEDGLSPAHIQRIQSGWMSLSLSWSQFRSHDSPYRFADTPCAAGPLVSSSWHHENCIPYFGAKWTEAIADAEAQYPHLTQLASRLSHVAHHLLENNSDRVTKLPSTARCLAIVIKRFNLCLQDNMLTTHFFPTSERAPSRYVRVRDLQVHGQPGVRKSAAKLCIPMGDI